MQVLLFNACANKFYYSFSIYYKLYNYVLIPIRGIDSFYGTKKRESNDSLFNTNIYFYIIL